MPSPPPSPADDPTTSGYTPEQKDLVRAQYRFCRSRADKVALSERAGLDSLESLYNLANRLGVTRPHQDGDGPELLETDERLLLREDPETTSFTQSTDGYLTRHFGAIRLDQIAYHLGHTESALMVRARALGLRRFAKYWEAHRVVAWLGADFATLDAEGVTFYALEAAEGGIALVVASTSSLLRALEAHRAAWESRGADGFFLTELSDVHAALHSDDTHPTWEPSRWVSHGHVCLNPWAGVSFGLFDDGSDLKIPGRDIHPQDIACDVPREQMDDLIATCRVPG